MRQTAYKDLAYPWVLLNEKYWTMCLFFSGDNGGDLVMAMQQP